MGDPTMVMLIDGNAILNVITNVVVYGIRGNSNFDLSYIMVGDRMILKDSSKQLFRNSMLKYLTSIVTPFGRGLDAIYFAFDSVSWRKFYIEKYFQRHSELAGFTYKGHRKSDDSKREMYMFFSYFANEIMPELLRISGIHSIRVKGTEGDDVMAVLDEIIDDDKIIWTVDSDINQLVRVNGKFTIVIGPKNKKNKLRRLVIPEGYDKKSGLMDFSVDNYGLGQIVKYLTTEKEYEAIMVDPNELTLRKIIMGDLKSDNIPGIYVRISESNRRMGITDAKADKILCEIEPEFPRSSWLNSIDSGDLQFVTAIVAATVKAVGVKNDQLEEITNNFMLNRRLIRLSSHTIPPEMVRMVKYKYSLLDQSKKFDYNAYLEYAYVTDN
jgi:hypothetical protein